MQRRSLTVPSRPPLAADYEVHVAVRNGRLLRHIRAAGFESIAAFCRDRNLHYSQIDAFCSLRGSRATPYRSDGSLTPAARRLCDALNAEVDELFPPAFLARRLAQTRVVVGLTEEQLESLLRQRPRTPEELMLRAEAAEEISRTLTTLTPREERVMRLRYGFTEDQKDHSLEEVGGMYQVSRERIRQIEQKGERKLRHPSRTVRLAGPAEVLEIGAFGFLLNAARRRAKEDGPVDAEPQPEREPVGWRTDDRPTPIPKVEPKPVEPDTIARPVRRKRRFKPPPPPVQHVYVPHPVYPHPVPDFVRILRIPAEARSDELKRALAYHLESEFMRRGAGPLRVLDPAMAALSPEALQMAKYEWFVTNLEALWRHYPPAPSL